jgi:hypothetical protein
VGDDQLGKEDWQLLVLFNIPGSESERVWEVEVWNDKISGKKSTPNLDLVLFII